MSSTPFKAIAEENKVLREQNAHLRRALDSLWPRIAHLEGRDAEQQQWNAEAQRRVGRLEAASGMALRHCPQCDSAYPDGLPFWPGYTSRSHPGDPRCQKCFPEDDSDASGQTT